MIKGTEDTRYAFVNGIVRAREARLLTKGHFDRLIAGTLSSFPTILADTSYVGDGDIPTGLERAGNEIKKFFRNYCLTPEVQKLIDWPEQIHNLKVKLKQGSEDMMYLQQESEIETWSDIIGEIERFAIDLENIRSFFRAHHFERSKEIFSQVFIKYGSLGQRIFLENLSNHHDVLAKNFFTTPYARIMEKGSLYIEEHHSFLTLERLCEEMRLEFLVQARKMTFGVEPLFTYYQCVMNEIKKLRQVYWGKLNEVPIDELKESIPDVW
jgi:vacuolar-type H+-ATPase subunit C/Vma6